MCCCDMTRIKNLAYWPIGQMFDDCRISVTRISAPKILKVVLNTNIFLGSK
jgi:hypothetical protein